MDNEIKNMMTALRAVTELQNPTIRDRHWKELFTATGANFTMSEQTTFADLLGLNLHKFEDEVKIKLKIFCINKLIKIQKKGKRHRR
jgi:dynein heavy chain